MSDSVVYFVESGDYIKIGITTNLKSRLAAIATHSPHPITLIRAIPGGLNTEYRIHRRFTHLHSHGEWFRDTPELRQYIAEQCLNDIVQETESARRCPADIPPVPAWLDALLTERGLDLERVWELSSIYPRTLIDWANSKRVAASVSGKVGKAIGMTAREFQAMRDANYRPHRAG